MLKHEDIAKIQEIKGKFNKIWLSSEYLQAHLNILGFNKIQNQFGWCKKAGFSFKDLIATLLVFPLIGINSIYEFTTNKAATSSTCGKDAYYRILANQKVNRRAFLAKFVKQYLLKDAHFTPPTNTTRCLIFDDTDLSKTGKTIEGISKIYNHVSKTYYLGFKLLVAGYWNGSVFIPIDISKRGKNGKWHTLITTDTALKFVKAMEVYSIRWSIEVFFKEAKQLFGLGKCQSTNFDAQIAQITIIMTQYLLTSIRYRMEAYETLGGLFKDLKQDYIENKLNIRILAVVNLIMTVLEKLIESIDIEYITQKIIANIEDFGFLTNTHSFKYQAIG